MLARMGPDEHDTLPGIPLLTLAFFELGHLYRLNVPAWVFDVNRLRICWANQGGLELP